MLLDRGTEHATLDRLLAEVRTGESRALVLRGEAGIGKTALMEYVSGQATGCRTVRAAGVEAEQELAFAALHQICAPMLDHRLDQLPVPVPGRRRMSRRTWVGNGRAHIEVRGIDRPGNEFIARRLEERLKRIHGVHWAEVNAVLGRVVVVFDDDAVSPGDLLDTVKDVEEAHELETEDFAKNRPEHPADVEPLLERLAALSGEALGFALAALRPALGRRTGPSDLLAALALIEATPRLRDQLSERLGRAATDLTLALTHAVAQGLAGGPPLAVLTDAAYRAALISEINARRTVWRRREPELCTNRKR